MTARRRRFDITIPIAYLLVFGPAVALGFVLAILTGVIPFPTFLFCRDETLQERRNVSGYDFKIVGSDCDGGISILVSTAGHRENAVLLTYDPMYDSQAGFTLPLITVSERGNISISIKQVNQVFSRVTAWNEASVSYEIGQIKYPRPEGTLR